ncbi:hypothetical protein ACMGDK_11405 [Chryseobacterium sp. DT-3]|uniref:hypothetical protein n=1 Tax=Chryseobacterium sp. DT-3 TaxID=3396164 RepID=UPI003F1C2586
MKVRKFQESDFVTIEKWLKWWSPGKEFNRQTYPDTGLIMYDEESGTEIYSGFIWTSNSKMAMIGFISRNPFYKNKAIDFQQTLREFIGALFLSVKELGYDYVITWAEHSNLKKEFREIGMLEAGTNVSEFITKII